jgi:hypothetical protein
MELFYRSSILGVIFETKIKIANQKNLNMYINKNNLITQIIQKEVQNHQTEEAYFGKDKMKACSL